MLGCANAAGTAIPPMTIFPGKRFRYNPMEDCLPGSYFGSSDNGWINTEIFYGWLANHFIQSIPPKRPVILLLDGHSSHIDIEISQLCRENKIILYCLPPHASHIVQPLDLFIFLPPFESGVASVCEKVAKC